MLAVGTLWTCHQQGRGSRSRKGHGAGRRDSATLGHVTGLHTLADMATHEKWSGAAHTVAGASLHVKVPPAALRQRGQEQDPRTHATCRPNFSMQKQAHPKDSLGHFLSCTCLGMEENP